eukprot:c53231_g1_i1.p1 GENE.c53231_g1_i1~~c53231_g1_i1.p1  ORF type:complete len:112 (+),score=6.31 c53231_g1_i1:31-366(+)
MDQGSDPFDRASLPRAEQSRHRVRDRDDLGHVEQINMATLAWVPVSFASLSWTASQPWRFRSTGERLSSELLRFFGLSPDTASAALSTSPTTALSASIDSVAVSCTPALRA